MRLKNWIPAILLSAMSVLAAPAKVFILAGQSNMNGSGEVSDLATFNLPSNFQIIRAIDAGRPRYEDWLALTKDNTDIYPDKFGPEMGLAEVLSKQFPNETIYFIKTSWGGTSLATAWQPGVIQYDGTFLGTVKIARAKLEEKKIQYELAGFFWMQGESDGHYEEDLPKAQAYKENLKAFVKNIRRDLNAPSLPFIYGKIANTVQPNGAPIWKYGSIVQQAQKDAQAEISNSVFVEKTANEPVWKEKLLPDLAHYNSQGILGVGRHFGEAWIAYDRARRTRALPALYNTLLLD